MVLDIKFLIYSIYLLFGLLLSPRLKVLPIYKDSLQCRGHELHQATFILLL